jgi:hypothetical protein
VEGGRGQAAPDARARLHRPETTVAFFGRDDGRAKAPAALVEAVKKAGGVVGVETTLKAKELPKWAVAEASKLGFDLDGAAARALVDEVGDRQQRLLRELEKLALEHGTGVRIGVEEVEAVAAHSAERQVWGLVDALVSRDRVAATRAFLELRAQGESLPRLIPLVARRLREVLALAVRLEAGESPSQIKASLKMGSWMADRRLKEARSSDADGLRRGLEALAELELATRGNGGPVGGHGGAARHRRHRGLSRSGVVAVLIVRGAGRLRRAMGPAGAQASFAAREGPAVARRACGVEACRACGVRRGACGRGACGRGVGRSVTPGHDNARSEAGARVLRRGTALRPRLLGLGAERRAQPGGAGLLARTRVAVQRAALDRLVDRAHEGEVLRGGRLRVAGRDRGLEAAEVRPDRGGVPAVLQALAFGPEDALLL